MIRSYVNPLTSRTEIEGFLEDITERRSFQEALEKSNSHFLAIMNALPDIYFEADRNGRYLDVNGRTENLVVKKEELLGRTVSEMLPEDAAKAILDALSMAAESGQALSARYSLPGKKGPLYRENSVAATGDVSDPNRHFVHLARDITDRVILQEQLLQSQKMEAVGRLAGGIAHDFNNILQVILGFCELTASHTEDQEAVIRGLRIISDSAKRAAVLTAQLLTFSRRQVPEMKVLNTSQLVKDMNPMLRRTLGEDINVEIIIQDSDCNFYADEGQFQQVIMNLAVNARDAMPSGGNLAIEVRRLSVSRDAVQSSLEPIPGNYVLVSVRDSGTGMDKEVQSHLFEPFFTTKELGKGTGLGLSIVYGIVKQFNGYISVQSEVGKGTTFDLFFPNVLPEVASSEKSVANERVSTGTETILLVEDDHAVQDLVLTALRSHGYTVLVASNGKEALAAVESGPRKIDLLVTDIVMPDVRGGIVADRFKTISPNAPVILMSGYSENEQNLSSGERDALTYFLLKPFQISELLLTIRKALDVQYRKKK